VAKKTNRKTEKKSDLILSRRVIKDIMRNLQALDKEIDKLISKKTSSH
jgi:hypothetical protein